MSSSQPIVAKSSRDTGTEPSVGCDEGTVDSSLNEAPQCPECGYTDTDARFHMDHRLCRNYPFFTKPGGYEVGCVRDGQPG